MWIDIIFAVLFLIGVGIYEIGEQKLFSLGYVLLAIIGGWFFFSPFKDFILGVGWKTIALKWIPIYLGVGVGVALLKWIQLNLKVASHIKDTREGIAKTNFQEVADKVLNAPAIKEHEQAVEQAKRDHLRATQSNYVYANKAEPKEVPPLVLPEAPAPVVASKEEVEAARRQKFIDLWNKSEREDDLPKAYTDSTTDWNDPEIITELLTPRAKKQIDRISFWVILWPFTVVSTVIGDLLIKFGKHVAKLFDRLFTGISKALIRHASKGI